jgi:hypothetical protein
LSTSLHVTFDAGIAAPWCIEFAVAVQIPFLGERISVWVARTRTVEAHRHADVAARRIRLRDRDGQLVGAGRVLDSADGPATDVHVVEASVRSDLQVDELSQPFF